MSTPAQADAISPAPGSPVGSGVRRVLLFTLAANALVSAAKIVVGHLTGSLAMVADGYHSLTDGLNNVVGLVVTAFAYAPPDEGHPYGHRKFETAATLAIGLALLSVAYQVVEKALGHVKADRAPAVGLMSWLVMGVTLLANLLVTRYESREGRRLNSAYLLADAAHTRSDIYVTLSVVASFAGARVGLPWVDAAVASGIAAFIAILGVRILVGSFNALTDRAVLPADDVAATLRAVPGVLAWRDIRTRGEPGAVYVDLVVHVDGNLTLRAAHEVADRIEEALKAAHPGVLDVVVHVEPAP
jgi:cation diffusion facilitator family transporter